MRSRFTMCIAVVLLTMTLDGVHLATAWEPTRLDVLALTTRQQFRSGICSVMGWKQGSMASLAARQDLRDEVCIAMSDGGMSRSERYQILSDAKGVLSPEEFEGFKQSLDRFAPPTPKVAKHSTKAMQKNAPTAAKQKAKLPAGEVFVTDQMASAGSSR